jgi:NAD(P) transhydrogenase subunit alpha
MIIAVPKETFPGETRVALTPTAAAGLVKSKQDVRIETGAGLASGFPDALYEKAGVKVLATRRETLADADIVLQVRTHGANPVEGRADVELLKRGSLVIGHADPLTPGEPIKALAEAGATLMAMELIPRITRAQAMDVLSSQANLAGYKAVLLAAEYLPKIFPMLMTAAGTIQPAQVLVLGAGVAGLQAIATARRLGAVVHGWDVRAAANEQIRSLGAKVLELQLEASGEGQGGYAKAQSAEQEAQQQRAFAAAIAKHKFDVIITTAAIPGRPSPKLLIEDAVKAMAAGSVIVDLGAERGGNCVLTESGKVVVRHDVTIVGTLNLPALVANHASQMYAGNLTNLLKLLITKEGTLKLDTGDEIIAACLVTRDGQVINEKIRQTLGLPPLPPPTPPAPPAEPAPAAAAPAPATPPAPVAPAETAPTTPPVPAPSAPAEPAPTSEAASTNGPVATPTPSEPAPAEPAPAEPAPVAAAESSRSAEPTPAPAAPPGA